MTIEKYEKARQLRADIFRINENIDSLSRLKLDTKVDVSTPNGGCGSPYFYTQNKELTEKVIDLLFKELTLQKNKLEAEFKKL